MIEPDESSAVSRLVRELPKRRGALAGNIGAIAYVRGSEIARQRWLANSMFGWEEPFPFVYPWNWTASEWRKTVFPWK